MGNLQLLTSGGRHLKTTWSNCNFTHQRSLANVAVPNSTNTNVDYHAELVIIIIIIIIIIINHTLGSCSLMISDVV